MPDKHEVAAFWISPVVLPYFEKASTQEYPTERDSDS